MLVLTQSGDKESVAYMFKRSGEYIAAVWMCKNGSDENRCKGRVAFDCDDDIVIVRGKLLGLLNDGTDIASHDRADLTRRFHDFMETGTNGRKLG